MIPKSVPSIGRGALLGTQFKKNMTDEFNITNGILLSYKGTESEITIPESVKKNRRYSI